MHTELSPQSHTPSELDVFDVRSFLLQKLSAELGDDILDNAEYWPSILTESSTYLRVPSWIDGERCESFSHVITPPIPTTSRLAKTKGIAQDEVETEGIPVILPRPVPYAASWTWFDAEIWRPNAPGGTTNPPIEASTWPASFAITSSLPFPSPADETLEAAGYHRIISLSTTGHFTGSKGLASSTKRCSRDDNHPITRLNGTYKPNTIPEPIFVAKRSGLFRICPLGRFKSAPIQIHRINIVLLV
ncbi:hypothetical protein P691DRAFT_764975 [Macrolepiota fuliginosa MF-IS2]|uniref:Uncharacterized protein n=1 Tax=Macrolepiota fuliginosa MF-IS2 TaxID=1400762 RepID=A0A9P6BYM5_9AGAR|nr:hypothetical protein P691DRAFT_764975 [Macrolepiota fuliginosa MF-IS2]